MLKTSFKKQTKSQKTMVFFFFIMMMCYGALHFLIFPSLPESSKDLQMTCTILFVACMFLWVLASSKDPGYLKRDSNLEFLDLLEQFEANCLCPEC
jgi:hypothetical protein